MLIRSCCPDGRVRVQFRIGDVASTRAVSVVGDFNDWESGREVFSVLDGSVDQLEAEVLLQPGREYAFRYLAEDGGWFDDDKADAYVDNGMGGMNGVLRLEAATEATLESMIEPAIESAIESTLVAAPAVVDAIERVVVLAEDAEAVITDGVAAPASSTELVAVAVDESSGSRPTVTRSSANGYWSAEASDPERSIGTDGPLPRFTNGRTTSGTGARGDHDAGRVDVDGTFA